MIVQRPRQGKYSPTPERDVDLVVCVGAAVISAVWRLFADHEAPPTTRRSVSDAMGEIDIVLSWSDLDVHVENKVDAPFRDRQAERHRERAEQATTSTVTVLLAPKAYLVGHASEAGQFDRAVSYEALVRAIESDSTPLAGELAQVVRGAIDQHASSSAPALATAIDVDPTRLDTELGRITRSTAERERTGEAVSYSPERTAFFHAFALAANELGLPFLPSRQISPTKNNFSLTDWQTLAGQRVELVAKFDNPRSINILVGGAASILDRLVGRPEMAGRILRTTKKGTLILGEVCPDVWADEPVENQASALAEFVATTADHVNWWQRTARPIVAAELAR